MMGPKRALAEAQRRWGAKAAVQRTKCRAFTEGRDAGRCSAWFDRHPRSCPGGVPVCKVGLIELGLFFSIRGSGPTFEAAFADASDREARDRAGFCRSKASHGPKRRCARCKYRGPAKREGLGQLQPDGTLLTTAERVAAWESERAEVQAARAADKAAEKKRRAEARMMTGREPTVADVLAVEADRRIPEDAAAELARRGAS